jgi:hypothetical protein
LKVLLKENIKYLPITTTTDKWVKNTPKKANTLSENWVKKYFTITFDGHAALGRTEYFSQKAKQLNNY